MERSIDETERFREFASILPESTEIDSIFETDPPCRRSRLCQRLDLCSRWRCSEALHRTTGMKISLSEHSNRYRVIF